MKVLVITNLYPPLHVGGYELVARAAVRSLREAGHEVQVLCSDHRREEERPPEPSVSRTLEWYSPLKPPVKRGPGRRWALLRQNLAQLDPRLDAGVDVACVFSMGGLSLAMLERLQARGVPTVGFVEDDWFDYARDLDQWQRMFAGRPALDAAARRLGISTGTRFARTATWAFNSRHTADAGRRAGLAFEEIRLVAAPIEPVFFSSGKRAPGWEGRLLVVGRIEPRKGVDLAVEAVARSADGTSLRIVGSSEGEGPYVAALRRRIAEPDLAGRVTLAPPVDPAGLAQEYRRADALLFPVRWAEPRGRVPLEAMAGGTPVIAARTGGAAEYLRDGDNCLAVAPDSVAALVAAIETLAGDPALRDRLRDGGRATAAEMSPQAFAAQIAGLIAAAQARMAAGEGPA